MKNKRNVKRLFGYSMAIGSAGLIAGKLPTAAKAPVQIVATIGSKFVAPIVGVTGASITLKQLERLKLKKRRRRYK